MAMNMKGAFNSRMTTKLIRHSIEEGHYDENNDWIEGRKTKVNVWGVFTRGNRFSQFDEGIAVQNMDGGIRLSNYRSLYMQGKYTLKIGDKIEHKGKYYNVLQQSDESEFNFNGYLLEESENWKP